MGRVEHAALEVAAGIGRSFRLAHAAAFFAHHFVYSAHEAATSTTSGELVSHSVG